MIGIIGAMQMEVDNLKESMTDITTETYSGVNFICGKIDETEIVAAVCGVGKVFAAICAEAMILKYNVDMIINIGVAGALTKDLGLLDVAVATQVVQHDMDTSAIGDPVGLISGINIIEIPADKALGEKLSACAKEMNVKTVSGVIASGDQFVASSERKAFITEHFSAIACEMEGAAIGQVCYVNQVPFCVLRAISDSADGSSHMDYPVFVKMAAEQSVKLMRRFLAD